MFFNLWKTKQNKNYDKYYVTKRRLEQVKLRKYLVKNILPAIFFSFDMVFENIPSGQKKL